MAILRIGARTWRFIDPKNKLSLSIGQVDPLLNGALGIEEQQMTGARERDEVDNNFDKMPRTSERSIFD